MKNTIKVLFFYTVLEFLYSLPRFKRKFALYFGNAVQTLAFALTLIFKVYHLYEHLLENLIIILLIYHR